MMNRHLKIRLVYVPLLALFVLAGLCLHPRGAEAEQGRVKARKLKPAATPTPPPMPSPTPKPTAESEKPVVVTEVPPPSPAPKRFEGSIEGSLVLTSGNTNTKNLGLAENVIFHRDQWDYQIRSSYLSNTDHSTITAEKFTIEGRAGRQLSARTDVFANLYYLKNRFAGFEDQLTPDVGYGYEWILSDPVQLRTEAALGYNFEKRTDNTTSNYAIARLGLLFAWALSATSEFRHETNVIPSFRGGGEWRMRSETYVSSQVTSVFATKISYHYEYNSSPVPGKASGDSTVTAAIVAKF